jgi:AcrR family transcriptional regulator
MTEHAGRVDVDDAEDAQGVPAWRSRAVERSLERARNEAEARSSRFVSTALALVEETGSDFTVQEVVEKMRVSTRSFYQYFSGKDELLIAMYEEIQRERNRELRQAVAREPDALARIRAFVVGTLRVDGRNAGLSRFMVQQYFRLQLNHPDELRQSYRGVVTYLGGLIGEAAEEGTIHSDDFERTAAIVLQIITTTIQMIVVGSPLMDPPPTPEEAWQFCLVGLGTKA